MKRFIFTFLVILKISTTSYSQRVEVQSIEPSNSIKEVAFKAQKASIYTITDVKEKESDIGDILFARHLEKSKQWSILSIDSEGKGERVLIPASGGQGEYNPDVSQDGKTILFNTYRYGGWKLATYNIKGDEVIRRTYGDSYFMNATLSPNGTMIAFEKGDRGQKVKLAISDINGKNIQILAEKLSDYNILAPTWSPDGKYLLFYTKDEENAKTMLYEIEIETGEFRKLNEGINGNQFSPVYSNDGSKIAYYSDENGYLDIFIMDRNGENKKLMSRKLQAEENRYHFFKDANIYWFFNISFSPNDTHIVFSNIKTDNVDLFTTTVNGEDLKQITNTPESEFTPTWGVIN